MLGLAVCPLYFRYINLIKQSSADNIHFVVPLSTLGTALAAYKKRAVAKKKRPQWAAKV